MTPEKFERKARALVAEIDALLPELTPPEHRTIARGIATLQAFSAEMPKEKSIAAGLALDRIWALIKLTMLAHAPVVGLGAQADATIKAVLPQAIRDAANVQSALGPIASLTAEGDGAK